MKSGRELNQNTLSASFQWSISLVESQQYEVDIKCFLSKQPIFSLAPSKSILPPPTAPPPIFQVLIIIKGFGFGLYKRFNAI